MSGTSSSITPGMYYSPSNRGFYTPAVHSAMPTDATPVTQAAYAALLAAQAAGHVIAPDATGNPVASAPAVTVAGSLAALAAAYASREAAGVSFQASGASAASVFPSDNNGQLKLVSAYSMASAGLWVDGTPWLTTTGVSVPMTKADIQAMAPKIAAYVAACTARYGALISLVTATPTTDTSTGWPSNA